MFKRTSRLARARRATTGQLGSGQSLVEFALILPVFLLLILAAVDFGRVYLGWINLQQMARIGANYAADHASAWPDDGAIQARYAQILQNEADVSNCALDTSDDSWQPVFAVSTNPRPTGSGVTVSLDCSFQLLTPVIGDILGDSLTASASATFPVKEGIVVAADPGGGSTTLRPTVDFIGSPRSGSSPLTVVFSDLSSNLPVTWSWDFNAGLGGSGTGSADVETASSAGPHTVTYSCAGSPGDTCTFDVSLSVSNNAGTDAETRNGYISIVIPPDTGPIAEFTGTPLSGTEPLTVAFAAVDAGGTPATSWTWDFGDGEAGTGQTVSHTYDEGTYDVTLEVSDGTLTHAQTKTFYVVVLLRLCTVPDFANVKMSDAETVWVAAGFDAGNIDYLPPKRNGPNDYKIRSQTLTGGTIDPVPDGCDSSITVGP